MTIEELIAAMQAIIDEATASEESGGPGLTDEQAQRYEELEGKLARAQKAEEIQKRHAALKAPAPGQLITGAKAKADDTLERAFAHYLRTGQDNADIVELRAQSKGTDTAGGYTVPEGFRQKLVDRMKAFGGLASAVEEISTETGQNLEWPTLDDTANTGAIVAEGAVFTTGADLVFGTATLGAYKYATTGADASAGLRVSVELLQDAAFDVEGLISRKFGERLARIQAQHWVSGTGSGQPKGIVTGKTGVQTAANTGPTYKDLLTYIHSVDPEYRTGAKWAFNDQTLAYFRGLLDGNGRPILKPSTDGVEGAPGGETLLGYPVVVDQGFANMTVGSASVNYGVFGDLREAYVIRRVRDIVVGVNPYARMNYGQVEFSAWCRADGTQQNVNAYSTLTGKV